MGYSVWDDTNVFWQDEVQNLKILKTAYQIWEDL